MEVSFSSEPTTSHDNYDDEARKSTTCVDDTTGAQPSHAPGGPALPQTEVQSQTHGADEHKDDNPKDDATDTDTTEKENKNIAENSMNDSEPRSGTLDASVVSEPVDGTAAMSDTGEGRDNDMDIDDTENAASDSAEDDDAEMAEAATHRDAAKNQVESSGTASVNGAPNDPSQESSNNPNSEGSKAGAKDSQTGTLDQQGKSQDPNERKPATDAAIPQLPVMKGTLCYEEDTRRHLIRGMWNYENSTAFPPQRFELLRSLSPGEDLKKLPQDGEFHGSFSLMYTHITSKGKKKERSKVIPESGVNISFKKQEDGSFLVDGKGVNQFGVFFIQGAAKPNASPILDDPTYSIELRKRYEEVAAPAASSSESRPAAAAAASGDTAEEPLPPPSQSFPTGVICLRGKLVKEESVETLGVTEVVHKISGMWAAGLNFLTDGGPTNRFEYEHKSSSSANNVFPVSGRYSGWFDLTNDDGSRTRINERDVTLKFRKNNANGYNVEGRGTNVFGKYNITGTLTAEPENILTIFRHFQPRKIKAKASVAAPTAVPSAQVAVQRRPSVAPAFEPVLSLDDVETPPEALNGAKLEPVVPPASGAYSAVSRGILRVNDDGTHTCSGKWAVTREHFTNGQSSPFTFRLESHFAQAAMAASSDTKQFPLDSDRYKGNFQLKKQGTRYQTIIDQQVVMKFRLNSQGSYNVYGKGVNPIGRFNLVGTLVMSGKTGGQVELYRMYPPEQLAQQPAPTKVTQAATPGAPIARPEGSLARQPSTASLGTGGHRRESTRLVKLPSKLEDDDPEALLSRTMSRCAQILRAVREKDTEMGNFFAEPVDPVALGIPSYHQIIKEPMDLKTIHRRMETNAVTDPDEFARLVRLVFQNAMTFNVDPAHSVHQAARNLLVFFNQRFREVERIMTKIADEEKAKRGKEDRKRKRDGDQPKSLKRMRLEEAQALAAANANFFADIFSAAPANATTVTRAEFNMLLGHIQQLSKQLVETHKLLAELSPGDDSDALSISAAVPTTIQSSGSVASSVPERKKAAKRKSEPPLLSENVFVEDTKPLTQEEQELLADNIGNLPPEDMAAVVQIIREATPLEADEDDIDLDIDLLDVKTQRKLLRHVMKYVKKTKAKPKKKPKTTKQAPSSATSTSAAVSRKPATAAKPRADTGSFFAFGSKGDESDSDSDDDDSKPMAAASAQFGGKHMNNNSAKEFRLGDGLGDLGEDNDDDVGNGEFTANWSMPKTESGKDEEVEDDDDAWGAAREHAAVARQREADRKAREEKLKAEAEAAKAQRLKDAAARGEEIKAQRAEEEEKEALLKEQQEKEAEAARQKAREEARAQFKSVEQTVDLDAQRDIMKQYEQSFLDKDLGSASPSSDFGF